MQMVILTAKIIRTAMRKMRYILKPAFIINARRANADNLTLKDAQAAAIGNKIAATEIMRRRHFLALSSAMLRKNRI